VLYHRFFPFIARWSTSTRQLCLLVYHLRPPLSLVSQLIYQLSAINYRDPPFDICFALGPMRAGSESPQATAAAAVLWTQVVDFAFRGLLALRLATR